jgi:ABC-type dipeptide/oligopeptide/nickel transport system permease subunit
MSQSARKANPVARHRRAVRLKIVGPIALAAIGLVGVCLGLILAVMGGAFESQQITIIMSVVATLFLALPMAILCLVPYILLAVLASLMERGYARARGPLRSVRGATARLAQTTAVVAPRLARPLMALNVRLARWESMLRGQASSALPVERKASHE